MPATSEPEYGQDPFFVSPLIKGLKPWQVNITTMNGGYSEAVIDGIMYRLIECDGVEMFADRGVYLAVSNGSSFSAKMRLLIMKVRGKLALITITREPLFYLNFRWTQPKLTLSKLRAIYRSC